MKIRYLLAAVAASLALPAFAGTDDLSIAAQAAAKQLASDAAITGTPAGAPAVEGMATMSGQAFDVNGGYPPPVPEPQAWAMLAGGLMLVGAVTRRRRG